MKKIVTLFLLLAMCAAVFAACSANEPGGEYYTGNMMGAYYPEEEDIISSQSQSGVIETPFVKTEKEAISTFSADVDTASYTQIGRAHV